MPISSFHLVYISSCHFGPILPLPIRFASKPVEPILECTGPVCSVPIRIMRVGTKNVRPILMGLFGPYLYGLLQNLLPVF